MATVTVYSNPERRRDAAAPAGGTPALPFKNAVRIHQSLLAESEKRLLIWLAERTPRRINSDHLTALGLVGTLLAGIAYALARWEPMWLPASVLFLGVNWLGDSLDGTLARVRGRQRPRYGFYVDHVVDAYSALFLLGGLALSGYLHPMVALAMLIGFFLLQIETYLATYTLGSFQLNFGPMGPTEMRIVLAIGSMALLWRPTVGPWQLFDFAGVIATAGMFVVFTINAARHTAELYRQERLS